jgi:hypothetical protein
VRGVSEVKTHLIIDLSPLYRLLGEPKYDATTMLKRLLSSWGVKKYKVVEHRIPSGPFPYEVVMQEEVSERVEKRAIARVTLYDGHQTAVALVFEPFIRALHES